ncbi:hypothetical protein EYR36_003149 [Pleurotus pulmonarius]|nr:hypothetical protein EYR36_003149 [Pleurotus pulmonarius]
MLRLSPLHAFSPGLATYGIAFLLYLLLVRCLRWRRYAAIHKKFEAKFRTGNLTIQDAQEIVHTSALWDMPELLYIALSYATIKTFAIVTFDFQNPTVNKANVERRTCIQTLRRLVSLRVRAAIDFTVLFGDEDIILDTWIGCPILGREFSSGRERSDPRSMIATGRVNWLHSKYRIANDDYLYTLSLYVLEYLRWTDEHGWRQLSEMERQALLMFWSEMGRRLEIQGIPETLNDLKTWAKCYEEEHRCQAKSNFDIMSFTIDYNSRGPQHYEHLGHKEVMETAEGIYGSPIGAPWRIDRDDQGL